jgi:hypothetical protein
MGTLDIKTLVWNGSGIFETDHPIFRAFFAELRAPKMQLAVRQEILEIGTGQYSFYPTFFQNLTPRTATVHSNADNPKSPNLLLF